ncbi:MAG: mechanosensitive ion channel [Candidatus Omnitrophica bacterium]|nr:mechanosensitive ion channel [Candidatus Omnitrophota bacterium]
MSTLETILKWINTPLIHIGETPVTLSGTFASLGIILLTLLISKIFRRTITSQLQKKLTLAPGVTYAIERFIHYGFLVLGVIIAFQTMGLQLGSLAVIFGFLSVGIGFGLQNVASNFISGLILLIERPVSVGDLISVNGDIGRVLHVKMRSTVVMTLDNVAVIVPNSHLIENQVINWSIEDTRVRIHCPVGVEYGSDIAKVRKTLLDVAVAHTDVLKLPEPEVRFLEFGDSSLNFDLLVWIRDPRRQDVIKSEINYKIDAAFRKENITIPFPQRDLNLKMTPALEAVTKKI